MPLLFSYGTLQDEHVQLSVFGRKLVGRKDHLLGYKQELARVEDPEFARTSGKAHHSILRPVHDDTVRIEGTALEVTNEELELTDEYEPVEYKRVVANLASGGKAWVYVDAQTVGMRRVDDMIKAEFKAIYGRCECGGVRYKVTAPARELYHCHCSRCRRLHGALFATYAYVEKVELVIEEGAENTASYSSPLANWRFCRNCGCHLFAEHSQNPGAMWYMPATLEDDSDPGHPEGSEKHIFVGSKSSLEAITDDLPQFEEYAPPTLSVTSRKSPGDA